MFVNKVHETWKSKSLIPNPKFQRWVGLKAKKEQTFILVASPIQKKNSEYILSFDRFHFLSHFGSSNPCWHPKVTSFSCLRTSDTCIEDMQYTQNKFLINQWWVSNYIIWALPSCSELNWCTFVPLRCKFTKKDDRPLVVCTVSD